MAVNADWYTTGWHRILPEPALAVQLIVSTATVDEIDGDLDELLAEVVGGSFPMMPEGWESPAVWSYPDEKLDDEDQAIRDRCRDVFETAMANSDRTVPTTARELAHLMADLGIFVRSEDGQRWRCPHPLPLPQEVLPLPDELVKELDQWRWRHTVEPYAQAIIVYVIETLNSPDEFATTLQRLAQAIELDIESVRQGLTRLGEDEFSFVRDGQPVDPETLLEHARFMVRIDWKRFNENRFQIRLAEPRE